jgi:uncharacterized glyoxalase superfamily protein PhnB
MKQRINILTLGVNDLEKSLQFLRDGFGWHTQGIIGAEYEHGEVVLFELNSGMILSLYQRENLAWDSCLERGPDSVTEFSIGHLVNTGEEVDKIMKQAEKAGAEIVKPAQKTFWGGYGGYFKDLDGHLWEIAYNPAYKIEE